MSFRRPHSTMHSVELDDSVRILQGQYPFVPAERLADLQSAGATEAQYRRTNDVCKRETDNQLQSYVLRENLKYADEGRNSQILGVRVAVIGSSGSGKSATGNTLLQSREFQVSSGATAQTTREAEIHSTYSGLIVVDTPGSWTLSRKERIDMYVLVINLASPRFHRQDLDTLRKLRDYNYILRSGRCILLLTHAREALRGRGLGAYLQEITGDPLHDLIDHDLRRDRVMAVNNDCLTRYEAESQWRMVTNLLARAYTEAIFTPDFDYRPYLPVIIGVALFLGFIFIVGMSIIGHENNKEANGK